MDKATMTVKELQMYVGIGRRQAYELCNTKGFPAFRIGRKVLINREGLNLWLKEQEGKTNAD